MRKEMGEARYLKPGACLLFIRIFSFSFPSLHLVSGCVPLAHWTLRQLLAAGVTALPCGYWAPATICARQYSFWWLVRLFKRLEFAACERHSCML